MNIESANTELNSNSNDSDIEKLGTKIKVARVEVVSLEHPDDRKEGYCGECLPPPPPDIVQRNNLPEFSIVLPLDVFEFDPAEEEITSLVIIGTTKGKEFKVTKIAGLESNSRVQNLQEIVLRSSLISRLEGLRHLSATLTKLELYDNQIDDVDVECLSSLKNLRILDLSFNALRSMDFLEECDFPFLEELYIAQNKLRKIEGLRNTPSLRILDLGANRIRVFLYS